jgi:hypothetical protein
MGVEVKENRSTTVLIRALEQANSDSSDAANMPLADTASAEGLAEAKTHGIGIELMQWAVVAILSCYLLCVLFWDT